MADLIPVLVETPALRYQRVIQGYVTTYQYYPDESLHEIVSDYRDAAVGTESGAARDAAVIVLRNRERTRHSARVREAEGLAARKTAPHARMHHF